MALFWSLFGFTLGLRLFFGLFLVSLWACWFGFGLYGLLQRKKNAYPRSIQGEASF